ncbi:glycerol kinase [Alkalihalobacillus sp. AL-G]|uniref:glycerol kinase n=1 Tax=Alkalihalobacillus sp. AL-G TaxID=2926399 RepID=UPI00272ACBBE|nr:glycerol kinase [Alkalihalobacillus sp. AL-G]WLD94468.1 glycerol kinase [Alkalihalobacillus sp. AL-G]
MNNTSKVKYLSSTNLAKEMNISTKEIFERLLRSNWIDRVSEQWVLTEKGREKGGLLKSRGGRQWIGWPSSVIDELELKENNINEKFLSTTKLAEEFDVSRFRINPILSELGWIEKDRKGWITTKLGESFGGKQLEHNKTGVPYVKWPETILENKRLVETIEEIKEGSSEDKIQSNEEAGFREKFIAKHRAADGHFVRSKAEMLIDNWLYMSEIAHAYERRLPIEEEVYSDFYLPVGKVYIEYWGYENDPKYIQRKKTKLEIYQKYEFNLIELNDKDIQNLDDVLPKKLLKFGIQSY